MKAKFPANWGVQIAGMIFQTRSNTYLREAGNIESPTLLLLRCDEAEKEEIYEASYKTYLLTGKVLPFCTLVAMLLHMVWNTGVLAIIIPAFLWILSAFNFCRCCVTKKSEKLAK